MKNYFTSLLVSLLICTSFAACSSDEEVVSETPKTLVQIFYMPPLEDEKENSIYKLELDGKTFISNDSPVMYIRGCFPGNTRSWFLLETEKRISIKLYKGKNMEPVYDKEIPPLEEGNYYIIIHNFQSDPVVVETPSTMEPMETCRIQFFNFMHESSPEEPSTLILQCQYCLDKNTYEEEWHNLGLSIPFGQHTERIEPELTPEDFADALETRLKFRFIDVATGEPLKYEYFPNKYTLFESVEYIKFGQYNLLFLSGIRNNDRKLYTTHFSKVY